MATSNSNYAFSILIINPNTSTHMTDALKPIVDRLGYADIHFEYFTAPSKESVTLPDGRIIHGIPSIDSGEDSAKSALHCKPFVQPLVSKYDGFLVACYSAHPLVSILKDEIRKFEEGESSSGTTTTAAARSSRKFVTGIFEASVVTSLSMISSFHFLNERELKKAQARDTFGIVSTGNVWKDELGKAVNEMMIGAGFSQQGGHTDRFAGVETTGLTAIELHQTPPDIVRQRIIEATQKLVKEVAPHPVSAICMGCAGMAGMEEAVRQGCIEAYGTQRGKGVRIIDGVVAGAGLLVSACKAGF